MIPIQRQKEGTEMQQKKRTIAGILMTLFVAFLTFWAWGLLWREKWAVLRLNVFFFCCGLKFRPLFAVCWGVRVCWHRCGVRGTVFCVCECDWVVKWFGEMWEW